MDESRIGRSGNDLVEGQNVVLDYELFKNKTFYKCKLIYKGGRPPILLECDFVNSEFIFEGPALATVTFLHGMAQSEGGKLFVLSMLGISWP